MSTFDVVPKGEKRIGPERYPADPREISADFLFPEGFRTGGEVFLPDAVCTDILFVLVDIAVYDVVTVGSAECGEKGKRQDLVALTQKPGIGFTACQSCAVNS